MSKLYFGILLFLLPIICFGQVQFPFSNSAHYVSGYESEYQDLLDEWTNDPTGDTLDWQNELIDSLKTYPSGDNFWDRFHQLLIFAIPNNDDGEALVNWVNIGTYDADNVHSTAWTRLEGYTGDNTNDYISTNFNPNGVVSQDDVTYGVYVRDGENRDDNATFGYNETNDTYFVTHKTDGAANYKIHQSTTHFWTNDTIPGFYILTRRASDDSEAYKNGSSVDTDDDASTGVTNGEITLLGLNSAAGVDYQVAIFFVMDGVSDDEAEQLNRLFEAYLDRIGTGIQ